MSVFGQYRPLRSITQLIHGCRGKTGDEVIADSDDVPRLSGGRICPGGDCVAGVSNNGCMLVVVLAAKLLGNCILDVNERVFGFLQGSIDPQDEVQFQH